MDVQPAETFAELLRRRGDDDRPALLAADLSWSWRELIGEAETRAAIMLAHRQPGPFHVGVLLENTPENIAWIYGAAFARATIVGINSTRRGAALRDDIRHADCQLIVTDRERLPLIADLDLGLAPDRVLLVDDPSYDDVLGSHRGLELHETPAATDRLLLMFTSGSTGAPKAVICSSGRLAGTATGAIANLALQPDDVLYQSMPLFHGNAIMANLAPAVALGAAVGLRPRFSASQFLADVRRYQATYFNYVGRSIAYVLATPEAPDDSHNQLRHGFGTEASLRDRAEFSRRFACRLIERYGSSEGVISTYRPEGTPPESIGLPQPRPGSDVAIVDPTTGIECPAAVHDEHGRLCNSDAAIGEIVDRGGAAGFEGYYRNDEATAQRLHDGWYWSGDLAYRGRDGFLFFAGRGNDWLRVDSENFAAAPIESILSRHPDVVMAAVYATPDARTGDQVMTALELRPGAGFDPTGFAEFLDSQADLGTKWAPRFIRLIAAMPVTATNKVDKAPLRRTGWTTSDPVFWRPSAELHFEPFGLTERELLRMAFRDHDRENLLPDDAR